MSDGTSELDEIWMTRVQEVAKKQAARIAALETEVAEYRKGLAEARLVFRGWRDELICRGVPSMSHKADEMYCNIDRLLSEYKE